MLDAAAQHPGRTGRETLRLASLLLGLPRRAADEMLERVGLHGAAKRRVGNYSLGMRQRLGIGTALLGDPEVLILDEPANGMDPEGIRWMRHLLQDFAAGGGTVLLSSHLLGEVQATVDRLVVINGGRIVADDGLDTLLAGQGTFVRSLDDARLADTLHAAGLQATPEAGGLRVAATPEQVGRLAAADRQVLDRAARRRRRPGGPVLHAHDARGGGGMSERSERIDVTVRFARGRTPTTEAGQPPTSAPSNTALLTQPITATPQLSFGTLLRVELRKATDTRSGRWLLALIVGLSVLALGWALAHPADGVSFRELRRRDGRRRRLPRPDHRPAGDDGRVDPTDRADHVHPRSPPRTGAGRQVQRRDDPGDGDLGGRDRPGLAHHDDRWRSSTAEPSWAGTGTEIRSYVIIVATQVIMATAFGALAAQTTVAIGAFLAAPVVWAQVSEPLLGKAAPWFDVFSAYNHLASGHPLDHFAQTLTAVTLWVILPAAIGITRSLRREVK